jgi:type IV pilus assembly protein PilX
MNSLSIFYVAHIPDKLSPANASNIPGLQSRFQARCAQKQRGVVLFLTLIALLAMSLAAVALIRSVDTSAMIAGNLAFKQSATASGDAAIETSMAWLQMMTNTNAAAHPFVNTDPTHPLNQTNLAVNRGYYSNFNPLLDVKASSTWSGNNSSAPFIDQSGNTVKYIIQRMCRFANTPMQFADCLYNAVPANNNFMSTPTIKGLKPPPGQPPQVRVTVQSTGTNATVSYVQGFTY